MRKDERSAPGEPDYRTTFGFVMTMLAGIVLGWLGFVGLLWGRR